MVRGYFDVRVWGLYMCVWMGVRGCVRMGRSNASDAFLCVCELEGIFIRACVCVEDCLRCEGAYIWGTRPLFCVVQVSYCVGGFPIYMCPWGVRRAFVRRFSLLVCIWVATGRGMLAKPYVRHGAYRIVRCLSRHPGVCALC